MMRRILWWTSVCVASAACLGCGDDDGGYGGEPVFDAGPPPVFDAGPPPEPEPIAEEFSPAIAAEGAAFVLNETRGSIARIDPRGAIESRELGPGADLLVGPERGNGGAWLFAMSRSSGRGWRVDPASLEIAPVTLDASFNQAVMSPDGRWAIAYYDEREAGPLAGSAASKVAVIGAEGAREVRVGYAPSRIWMEAEGIAHLVTSEGISTIALADRAQTDAPAVRLFEGAPIGADFSGARVVFGSRGRWAAAIDPDSARLSVLDTASGEVTELALPALPHDLDLARCSCAERLLVTMPSQERAIAVEVPAGVEALKSTPWDGEAAPPSGVEVFDWTGRAWNQLAVDAAQTRAVAYQLGSTEPIGVLSLDDTGAPILDFAMRGAVRGVLAGWEAGEFLVTRSSSSAGGAWGMAVIDLSEERVSFLALDSEPEQIVPLTAAGERAVFVRGVSGGLTRVEWSTGDARAVELPSPARSIGALGGGGLFIDQEHPYGRLSFVGAKGEDLTTLTGFELRARIR